MVHAILGVRAPVRQWAAGIPTVAWTIEGRVDRERVNLRSMSRRAGFLSEVAAALASSLITATLNQTALGLTEGPDWRPGLDGKTYGSRLCESGMRSSLPRPCLMTGYCGAGAGACRRFWGPFISVTVGWSPFVAIVKVRLATPVHSRKNGSRPDGARGSSRSASR
jgi:hypothetical protein